MRLVKSKKIPLIFVYGGKFPEYGHHSIAFNSKYSKMDLILLCNKNEINFKIPKNIRLFVYHEFSDDSLFFLKKMNI